MKTTIILSIVCCCAILYSCSDSSTTTTGGNNNTNGPSGGQSFVLNHKDTIRSSDAYIKFDSRVSQMLWSVRNGNTSMLALSTTLTSFPQKGDMVILPLGYCSFYQFSAPTTDFDPEHDSISLEITSFDLATHLIEFKYSLLLHSTSAITIDHGTMRNGYFDILPDSSMTFSCTVNDIPYDNTPSSTDLYALQFYGHSHRGIYTIATDGVYFSYAVNPGKLGLGILSLSDPAVFISGQANLGIYTGVSKNIIFTSTPSTSTGSMTITEFDTIRHLVSGSFEARIKMSSGDTARIENGHFQHMRWFDGWE